MHEEKPAEQVIAATLPAETAAALLDLCEYEEQKQRLRDRFCRAISGLVLVSFPLVLLLAVFTKNLRAFQYSIICFQLVGFLMRWASSMSNRFYASRKKAISFLFKSDDIRVLIPLLDTFGFTETVKNHTDYLEQKKLKARELSWRLWNIRSEEAIALTGA